MRRKPFVVAVGLMAVSLGAAGYGYAALTSTNNVYTGCLYGGVIRNIKIGTKPTSACVKGTTQVSWNQQGQPGTNGDDGTSVSSTSLASGDANCPYGGSSFTSSSGTTYACNGATPATQLTPGQTESGLFTGGGGASSWIAVTIAYPKPLAAAIADNHVVYVTDADSATHCPGTEHADPGYLCLYARGDDSNIYKTWPIVYSDDFFNSLGALGVMIFWHAGSSPGGGFVFGSWAVTAP